MRRRNKWTAYLISICLVFSILGNGNTLFGKVDSHIQISSAEDLIKLAEDCKLDTWSRGKIVSLAKDIDVSGKDFIGIPIFGGTFEGNGHMISGVNLSASGSNQGFFRYIENGGNVKDLIVRGNVIGNGSKKIIGGLAGQNKGMIKDCTFVGRVDGESYIGGLVGINEVEGKIIGSSMEGVVTGTHYIGGIAGENLGTIIKSTNKAKVNNVASEVELKLQDLDRITDLKLNSSENMAANTDVGGITGFSTGILQGCKNYGAIGYEHIGYNVGGIAGRQSGYMNGCYNYGEIFGRKDVGGITGQVEPYITLQFSDDKLNNLQDELDKLQHMMNTAIDHANGYSNQMGDALNNTKGYIDSAIESTHSLTRQTEDLYNEAIDSVNDMSARVSDTLDRLTIAFDKGSGMGDDITEATNQLKEALDALDITSNQGKKALDSLKETLNNIKDNGEDYSKALEDISDAITALNESIGDTDEMESALKALSRSFEALTDSFKSMSRNVTNLKEGIEALEKWTKNNKDWNNLKSGLKEVSEALQEVSRATSEVTNAISKVLEAVDDDEMTKALEGLQSASLQLTNAMAHLEKALGALDSEDILNSDFDKMMDEAKAATNDVQSSMKEINTAIGHLEKAVSNEEVNAALAELETGLKHMSSALEKLNRAIKKINEAIKGLEEEKESGQLKEIKTQISDALKGMTNSFEEVTRAMSEVQGAIERVDDQIQYKKLDKASDKLETAVKGLVAATKDTDHVIDSLEAVIDETKETITQGDKVTNKIQAAVDTLHKVSTKSTDMAKDIQAIVTDLADKPQITLPNINSKYQQTTNDLNHCLGNISDSIGHLNNTMQANNNLLLDDLKSISDQFYVVINLIIDATLEDEEDKEKEDIKDKLDEYHEDISDQDTDINTQGKVAKCGNVGEIQGDVNVGGITGSMAIEYDFDPEDDVLKKGQNSMKFQYLSRAVVRECINQGKIIGKKNYIGGIVGRMDLGSIIECTGYGRIESTDGNYIGGIAGASYTHIKDSFAMCVLSGGSNIGGIAGYGSKMTHNYAMVDIEDYAECVGAIAGSVEEIKEQNNNYFVDRGIAGIDGISYQDKASPMAYDAFSKVPKLPKEFTSLALTFVADGEVVKEIPFKFGESLDESTLPEVPEKQGYYGRWPDFNYKTLTFSQTLEAIYTPYTTVIESTTSEEGKALALVTGNFDSDTVLSVTDASVVPPSEAGDKAKIWEIVLSDNMAKTTMDEGKEVKPTYEVRLLVGSKQKAQIYARQSDGSWQKVSAEKNGSYMIVQMEGPSGIYCIDYKSSIKQMICLIGGIAIIIGIIITLIKKKKFRSNQGDKMTQEQSI